MSKIGVRRGLGGSVRDIETANDITCARRVILQDCWSFKLLPLFLR